LPPGIQWVLPEQGLEADYPVYQAELVDEAQPWRHDSTKLAQVLMDLLHERTGPLLEKDPYNDYLNI
jgi:hypothetical protein